MVKGIVDYDIVRDHDHYVVYIDGKFFCTADRVKEAVEEVENYLSERR
jgi:hypothetical protein